MANEKLTFDLLVNSSSASTGFAAAGRAAAAASDDVQALTRRLDEVGKKSVKARVGLDGDKDADLSVDRLQLKLLKLGKTVSRPGITVDGLLRATVEAKGLELELDKLGKKSASISASGGGLSKLAAAFSGLFGGGGGAGGALSLAGGSPEALAAAAAALAPLLAEATALVSGFAAAGAGITAFGLLALPTFKNIATAYTGISAAHQKYMDALAAEKQDPTAANARAVTRALDALKVAQDNLSPSTKTAVGGIQSLAGEYHKLVREFQPDAMKVFNDGLGIANTLLPDLKPFADTAATAIDGLLKKVGVFFKSADFKKWLGDFEKIAGPAITAIGAGIGKVAISAGKLLTTMSAKDVVHAINIAFDTINAVLAATAVVVRYLMTTWDNLTARIRGDTADVKHVVGDLVAFFTSTVPTGFRLFRDEVGQVFNKVEVDVLRMAASITSTMGRLPGPLGAPFRSAHSVIAAELSLIEGSVAATAARINSDWARIHGTASIIVHADGTFNVKGSSVKGMAAGGRITAGTGPTADDVLIRASKDETVVSAAHSRILAPAFRALGIRGYASGGVVGSYSGAVPGLGPWMGRESLATQAMLEKLTAAATTAALKAAPVLGASSGVGVSGARTGSVAVEENFARRLLAQYGWAASQMSSLIPLWMQESGWNPYAVNASSGAYGIPQSLGHGHPYNLGDYQNQIIWGLNYIKGRYGSPAGAWAHERAFNWYDQGGYLPPGLSVAYNGTGRPEAVSTESDMKAMHAELKAMHASMVVMHKAIVGAVAKVAPGVAQGVNRNLNSAARAVVSR